MIVELPDHLVNRHGKTVFTALVSVEADGALRVMVPDPAVPIGADEDTPSWLVERFDTPGAIKLGAGLVVRPEGGGTA
jgi:hypothetical protein